MVRKSLDFTAEDADMIHNGLLARAAQRSADEPVMVAAR
jgi:hypothetical protein